MSCVACYCGVSQQLKEGAATSADSSVTSGPADQLKVTIKPATPASDTVTGASTQKNSRQSSVAHNRSIDTESEARDVDTHVHASAQDCFLTITLWLRTHALLCVILS